MNLPQRKQIYMFYYISVVTDKIICDKINFCIFHSLIFNCLLFKNGIFKIEWIKTKIRKTLRPYLNKSSPQEKPMNIDMKHWRYPYTSKFGKQSKNPYEIFLKNWLVNSNKEMWLLQIFIKAPLNILLSKQSALFFNSSFIEALLCEHRKGYSRNKGSGINRTPWRKELERIVWMNGLIIIKKSWAKFLKKLF